MILENINGLSQRPFGENPLSNMNGETDSSQEKF